MSDYFNGSGTIGFTCDSCGRETQGCTWVNGMKFCAKCYQETFGNTNPFEKELRDKIADLEAKLAEKEHSIEMLNQHLTDKAIEIERLGEELAENKKESDNYVMSAIERYADLTNRLAEKEHTISTLIEDSKVSKEFLKQQLAEKEKEIEDLKAQRHIYLNRSVEECNKITDLEFELQHKDQAKTDFAIEQLEKVKVELINSVSPVKLSYTDYVQEVFNKIDQQIKELKEGE